jgi:hypothetical protein
MTEMVFKIPIVPMTLLEWLNQRCVGGDLLKVIKFEETDQAIGFYNKRINQVFYYAEPEEKQKQNEVAK